MPIDPTFVYANYIEACFWAALGLFALLRRNSTWGIFLGITLINFGLSDVVETRTGAWYRPWWLLTWKAACILFILVFGLLAFRRRST